MTTVTRFAPSPTGHLHRGHAYAALFANQVAQDTGGRFVVRMEDIDEGRCRAAFEVSILEDLKWLGLSWETPLRRQSEHMDDYARAIEVLDQADLIYPCFCTRKDIMREIGAAAHAPHHIPYGPHGPLYPGVCRNLSLDEQVTRQKTGEPFALRLNMSRAIENTGELTWEDQGTGVQLATPEIFGDVVLARKDTPTSYHLAVTLDDHLQGVTLVTRGVDLFAATHVHRLLQALLHLDTPRYHHHELKTDAGGCRLAKRDSTETLNAFRKKGVNPAHIRKQLGFS